MKCPYCEAEAKALNDKIYHLMTDDNKIYDENLLQFCCPNEHQFYGYSESDANSDAEQMRYLKKM